MVLRLLLSITCFHLLLHAVKEPSEIPLETLAPCALDVYLRLRVWIKNFEPPKTRSRRMKFFRSDDNTGSKPLNSHLPSTPGILRTLLQYFDAVKKPSFNLAGVESPAKVPNNNSDGGQSELPKRTRFIELVARNNHSAIVDSMLLSASNSSECIESVLPTSPLRKFGEVPFEYGPICVTAGAD